MNESLQIRSFCINQSASRAESKCEFYLELHNVIVPRRSLHDMKSNTWEAVNDRLAREQKRLIPVCGETTV